MIQRQLGIVCFLSLITSVYAENASKFSGSYMYKNAERTAFFWFHDGGTSSGEIEPRRSLVKPSEYPESGITGTFVYDCSDTKFRCLRTSTIVLALPRGRLPIEGHYEAGGTEFSILECLRGDGKECQVALVRADCQSIKALSAIDAACEIVTGGRSAAAHPGPISYFVYNEDFGITSVGFPQAEGRTPIEIEKLARTYVLEGDVGLLRPENR